MWLGKETKNGFARIKLCLCLTSIVTSQQIGSDYLYCVTRQALGESLLQSQLRALALGLDCLLYPVMDLGSLPIPQPFYITCYIAAGAWWLPLPALRTEKFGVSTGALFLCVGLYCWSRDHTFWQHVYEFRRYMALVLVRFTFTLVCFKLFSLDVPSR